MLCVVGGWDPVQEEPKSFRDVWACGTGMGRQTDSGWFHMLSLLDSVAWGLPLCGGVCVPYPP